LHAAVTILVANRGVLKEFLRFAAIGAALVGAVMKRPNLEEALAERTAADDVATAAYWHNKRAIVIRVVRREPQGFTVLFDDGGVYVRRDEFDDLLELEKILKSEPGDDPSFLEATNEVLWSTHL